jgi:hypothetical protein
MNKRDALRLQPGQTICYGNSMWTAECTLRRKAEVIHVTPNGGIKVRDLNPNDTPTDRVHWVPYHP